MAMTSVTIRVDADTKRRAAEIADDFGLDLSTVTRAFYRQIVRERRIPISLEYPPPTAETLESVHEADALIDKAAPRFQTADDMFDALGI